MNSSAVLVGNDNVLTRENVEPVSTSDKSQIPVKPPEATVIAHISVPAAFYHVAKPKVGNVASRRFEAVKIARLAVPTKLIRN